MAVKTDRRDARGIAQLLRMDGIGRFIASRFPRRRSGLQLLGARKQLQIKVIDLKQTVRGLLRGFGLKVGDVRWGKLPARHPGARGRARHAGTDRRAVVGAPEAMWRGFAMLHREVLMIVKEDQVCRRLMTVPGVSALVSLSYRAGVDDFGRFAKCKSVGASLV